MPNTILNMKQLWEQGHKWHPHQGHLTALLELFQLLAAQLLDGHHHGLKGSLQPLPQDHVVWLCPQPNTILVFIGRQCNFPNIQFLPLVTERKQKFAQ